jgi:DNA-binding MarR family transcriptional regulator
MPAMPARFTDTQGQYLAFIHAYRRLHRRAPAETDFQTHFRVTPPTAHRMIVTLTDRGLIRRQPGEARSIELLVSPDDLPPLRERPRSIDRNP